MTTPSNINTNPPVQPTPPSSADSASTQQPAPTGAPPVTVQADVATGAIKKEPDSKSTKMEKPTPTTSAAAAAFESVAKEGAKSVASKKQSTTADEEFNIDSLAILEDEPDADDLEELTTKKAVLTRHISHTDIHPIINGYGETRPSIDPNEVRHKLMPWLDSLEEEGRTAEDYVETLLRYANECGLDETCLAQLMTNDKSATEIPADKMTRSDIYLAVRDAVANSLLSLHRSFSHMKGWSVQGNTALHKILKELIDNVSLPIEKAEIIDGWLRDPNNLREVVKTYNLLILGEQRPVAEKMYVFPVALCSCSGIRDLILDSQPFTQLPHEISKMTSLNRLLITDSRLKSLPDSICQLPLRELVVTAANLTSLPKELGNIATLQKLDVGGNPLTDLPESVIKAIEDGRLEFHMFDLDSLNPDTVERIRVAQEKNKKQK